MGLKRHPALQPFSRDHLIGLFHAQRLIKLGTATPPGSVDEIVNAFSEAWHREISVHFADEDRLLSPLPISRRNLDRLHVEHLDLTNSIENLLSQPDIPPAVHVGNLLDAHIRWEEHELFPEIESTLSEEALSALEKETVVIETSRHRTL